VSERDEEEEMVVEESAGLFFSSSVPYLKRRFENHPRAMEQHVKFMRAASRTVEAKPAVYRGANPRQLNNGSEKQRDWGTG
jgi:hypothetical protein